MGVTIIEDKMIQIETKDQLLEAIESYESWDGKEVTEIVTSPVQRYLRLANKKCSKLSGK